ncbi:hypothetical protein ACFO72_004577 [Enterobacter roggenkampii]
MRQLSVGVLTLSLLGFTSVALAESNPISASVQDAPTARTSLVAQGPGPVINPENSQYMSEKNATVKKNQSGQSRINKHHVKKHHKHHKMH